MCASITHSSACVITYLYYIIHLLLPVNFSLKLYVCHVDSRRTVERMLRSVSCSWRSALHAQLGGEKPQAILYSVISRY